MYETNLSSCRGFEGKHVGEGGDDVDGEANEERSDCGIDGTKERKDDGQKPYGNDHRQSSCGSFA